MEPKRLKRTVSLTFIFVLIVFIGNAKTNVIKLTCEYHTNPIGIDIKKPRLSWQLLSDENNVVQTAYQIRVAKTTKELSQKNKQLWNSGKIESSQSVNVKYEGLSLKSMQRVYWQVRVWDQSNKTSRWSPPAYWETGILQTEQWKAQWISMNNEIENKNSKPAQYFRKEFRISKKIKSARAYVTSHGLYELHLNGEKVGDALFTPGWTSYNKRLQYQTYDITSLLKGKNAIGVILGDGWYRGFIGWSSQHNYYGNKLALLLQLKIDYADGTSDIITTDKSWKSNTGPILESDIYNGEKYDARLEMPGWDNAGFTTKNWENVEEIKISKEHLIAPQGVPVKAIEEIVPIKQITTPKGENVFDMGQNMVGWVKIKMKGQKGQKVQLRFAEVLDKEGNFYTNNLRDAQATDTYIFKDKKEVVFQPKFTFHGFRFLQLIGFDYTPDKDDIKGIVIHSDMASTGKFTCSNELINQLQHNIQWGQKGNFLDVPTDCPQRDERLGWTGDAQVFCPTAAFNFNVAAFYTKWMKDVIADQLPNGKIPHVIPDVLKGQGGSTGWADVVAIIPWEMYKTYNDKRILEECYPAITSWVKYMEGRAGDNYLWTGDSHFGDWLAFATIRSDYPGATTEKDLIATAYFAYTTNLTAKIALVLGKKQDAERYRQLAQKIKSAFTNEFVTPNGRLVSHTQTAYVLALSFNLLPEKLKENAANYLAKDVEKFKHLTTGFLGTPLLCKTLSAIGRDDLAYMLLNRKEYPSWLYPVTQGATTIWERWDGQKPDGTFQNAGMNSFNHYAYGAIGEWMYTHIAGIQIKGNSPAYKDFYLAPHPGGGLTYAKAEYYSMYGKITSDWKIENNQMIYNVEIPENTSATVVLPQANKKELSINNKTPLEIKNKTVKQKVKQVTIKLGSGTYCLKYPYNSD